MVAKTIFYRLLDSLRHHDVIFCGMECDGVKRLLRISQKQRHECAPRFSDLEAKGVAQRSWRAGLPIEMLPRITKN